MGLRVLDPLSGSEWDALAIAHPDCSIFHRGAWARVLAGVYGHRPFYLHCAQQGAGSVLLPFMEVRSRLTGNRGVALPFSDFCPPLVSGRIDGHALVGTLRNLASERGWRWFELRDAGSLLPVEATPATRFLTHELPLTGGKDELFQRCAPSTRQAVRKAGRSGLTCEITTDRRALLDYYRLHVRTRRRHGLPPQSLRFFLTLHQELLCTGLGFISLVRQGAQAIAGAVFFHTGTRAVYKYGASDARFQSLRGNNLAMWRAIEFLSEKGFESLHFGRTSLTGDSLRRFKLGWGAREGSISYFRCETATGAWLVDPDRTTGWHTSIFSRLPLCVNRAIGGALYPHLD